MIEGEQQMIDADEKTPIDLRGPRNPRCALVFPIHYKTTDRQGADCLLNLSTGGLFLQTDSPLRPGERIQMRLSFPGVLDSTAVEGEVRWTRPEDWGLPGVGVAFCGLEARTRKQIDRLLRLGGAFQRRRAMPLVEGTQTLQAVFLEPNHALQQIFRYAIKKFVHLGTSVRWDLELDVASDPLSCMELLKEKVCSVVIIDFDRLEASPNELIALIRSNARDAQIPIIGLGGNSSSSSGLELPRSHTMILRKPIALEPLFRTLSVMLVTAGEDGPT
jgi:uncharacterized protein (TIGR02266 family)